MPNMIELQAFYFNFILLFPGSQLFTIISKNIFHIGENKKQTHFQNKDVFLSYRKVNENREQVLLSILCYYQYIFFFH